MLSKALKILFIALLPFVLVLGCQTGSPTPGAPGPQGDSQLAQTLSVPDATAFVQANREFAVALYKELRRARPDDNLLVSPHSVAAMLAMVYAGAREQTASQIGEAAHFVLPDARLHAAFGSLDADLLSRTKKVAASADPFTLQVANAAWAAKNLSFADDYVALLTQSYGAGPRSVDFEADPEAARAQINAWVLAQTNQRIANLLPPGSLPADAALVLTNAVYFKAAWAYPFNTARSADGEFSRLDNSTVTVPMMQDRGPMRYGEHAGHQVIELPYVGHEVSMIAILPEGDFGRFENNLSAATLDRLIRSLSGESGTLTMPRFSFDSSADMKRALQSLGMRDAFDRASADFSGMNDQGALYISDVFHKTFIAVDEQGTEAAAASAAVAVPISEPMGGFQMTLNRPFLLLIYDRPTSSVLFIGRVVDPS